LYYGSEAVNYVVVRETHPWLVPGWETWKTMVSSGTGVSEASGGAQPVVSVSPNAPVL